MAVAVDMCGCKGALESSMQGEAEKQPLARKQNDLSAALHTIQSLHGAKCELRTI